MQTTGLKCLPQGRLETHFRDSRLSLSLAIASFSIPNFLCVIKWDLSHEQCPLGSPGTGVCSDGGALQGFSYLHDGSLILKLLRAASRAADPGNIPAIIT